MSNVRISELPAATLPLTGAELVPVVQSGVTKQTAAANVSVGFVTEAELLASTAPARGAGEIWVAGLLRYVEALPSATDQHVTTAGGVKLYYEGRDPLSTIVGSRGIGVVLGVGGYEPAAIGSGCVLISGATDQPNQLIGYGQLRGIVGGYDNQITGYVSATEGLACFITGSHHSQIQGDVSHGYISGGSYNKILSGDYSNVLGGTQNEIKAFRADGTTPVKANTATICGGFQNAITSPNSAIVGGRTNSIDGEFAFVGAGRSLNAQGNFDVISGGAENQTARGPGASGSQNTISGGRDNLITSATGSPTQNVVAGGNTNKIYGSQGAISGGLRNTIGSVSANSNGAVISGGQDNFALADLSNVSGGRDNTVAAGATYATITGGRLNQATSAYSRAGGYYAVARHPGGDTYANDFFAAAGDAQTSVVVRKQQTTDASPASMTTIVLPDNSTYAFSILIVARRTDTTNESAAYEILGCIDRNTGSATTALVGSITKTVIAEDTAAWDVTAIANTGSGGLQIQVTGEAAKTIRWVARVTLSEVSA